MHGVPMHDCRSHALASRLPATFASDKTSAPLSSSMPAIVETANAGSTIFQRRPLSYGTRLRGPLLVPSIVLRV